MQSPSKRCLTREPRFRADCAEFFPEPGDRLLQFRGPNAVIDALEVAAVKSGRTFNAQICYVLQICLGHQQQTPDEPQGATDWRAMMAQIEILPDEDHDGPPWTIPFDKRTETSGSAESFFGHPQEARHELQTIPPSREWT